MALFYLVTDIIWEDPPETALNVRKKTAYTEFVKALRANPGKWALAPGERASADSAKNTAANIVRGKMRDFPRGEFQTAVDGPKLYVRFVKPADGQTSEPETTTPAGETEALSDVEVEIGRGAMIRQWARARGMDVPDRGRLKQYIVDEYNAEHST
jgi:hypothetical protein